MHNSIFIEADSKDTFFKRVEELLNDLDVQYEFLKFDNDFLSIELWRNIEKIIYQRPAYGKQKKVISVFVGSLKEETQNAMLKSLEEMPEFNIFYFGSYDKDQLLDTILSRVYVMADNKDINELLLNFSTKNKEQVVKDLMDKIKDGKDFYILQVVDFILGKLRSDLCKNKHTIKTLLHIKKHLIEKQVPYSPHIKFIASVLVSCS